MIKTMCSIQALERQATIGSEMGSSSVPYMEFNESNMLKLSKRSKSRPSIQEEKKQKMNAPLQFDK
jgi:hypothetical protein